MRGLSRFVVLLSTAAVVAVAACGGEGSGTSGSSSSSASASSSGGGTGGTGGSGGTGGGGTGGVTSSSSSSSSSGLGGGMICAPNSTASCYTGPPATKSVGICKPGLETCNADGTAYGPCLGEVLPKVESCDTVADEDCDGKPNGGCGAAIWSAGFGGSVDDEGNAIKTDSAGNVIVGGYARGTVDFGCGPLVTVNNGIALFVAKLDPAGACLWSKVAGDDDSFFVDVAINAADEIYLTGFFVGTADLGCGPMTSFGDSDIVLAKLSPAGVCLWSKHFGAATGNAHGYAIALDSAGNVIVSGNVDIAVDMGGGSLPSGGAGDFVLAKYTPAGAHVWSKRFGAAGNQLAFALAVDSQDDIVVGGQFSGTVDFGGGAMTSLGLSDVFLAKLTSAGAHVWSKRFGDALDQYTAKVRFDASDNIIAAGTFSGTINFGGANLTSAGGSDTWLIKLDPAGGHVWSRFFGGVQNQLDAGLAIDALGNIVVSSTLNGTGNFGCGPLVSAGSTDIVVTKYDSAGGCLWSKRFGDVAAQVARDVAFDPAGNVLLTGLMLTPTDFGNGIVAGGGGEDIFVAKFSP